MSMTMKEQFSAIDMAEAAANGFRDGQKAAQYAPNGAMAVTDEMINAACNVCIGFSGDYGEHNDYLSREAAKEVLEAALAATKAQPAA